ncbi:MAG TPA: hypothetical protein VI603_18390, partial [Saprospiraceae bacterium]|nr:hypothetical protein [Saprospiraceae bacterium]
YAFLIKVVRRTKGIGQKMRLFLQSIAKLNERFSKQELMRLIQPENKKGEIHSQTKRRGWRILLIGILLASLGLVLTMMAMEDNWTTVQKIMGALGVLSLSLINGIIRRRHTTQNELNA